MVTGMKEVPDTTPAEEPSRGPLEGKFVRLESFAEKHLNSLWDNYELDDTTWTWLPGGEPESREVFDKDMIADVAGKNVMFAVMGDPAHLGPGKGEEPDPEKFECLAIMGYGGDYNLKNRTLEAGVIASTPLRRTYALTEAHYLLLRNVFAPEKGPGYRRVSWKTNVLNKKSRGAAERMGYVHEGTWRNEMIDRGRSRDTAWYAIIEEDWPLQREALEQWLDLKNFNEDGGQIKSLKEIKESLK